MTSKHTFNILFFIRKDKANSEGEAPIYLRITVDGVRSHYAVKRYIHPNRWDSKANKAKGSKEDARQLNEYLDTLRNKVYEIHKDLIDHNITLSAVKIKNRLAGHDPDQKSLLEVFRDHNQSIKELVNIDYAPATITRYQTTFDHVVNFMSDKYNIQDIYLKELQFAFITDFEHYLKTVRKCGHNTTLKYIRNFKKIINLALKNGWLDKDPFKNYKGRLHEVMRGFLTEEEMLLIEEKEFSTARLEQVRDIFIFSCYTGFAYVDVAKLTKDEINTGIDGDKWIFTERTKTKIQVKVPLLPKALEIIEKYDNHPEAVYKGTLLPVLSNQKLNSYLKEIGDVCGIKKNLTFHLARHTFATTVTLPHGVSIETVSSMLGHKNFRTTQVYAKVVEQKVSEEMKVLKDKFKNDANKVSGITNSSQ